MEYKTSAAPNLTFTRLYANHTATSVSFMLGMGMDVDILPNMRLGAGYRFADLGHAQLGSAVIDTTPVTGNLSQSHLYTQELIVQLTCLLN